MKPIAYGFLLAALLLSACTGVTATANPPTAQPTAAGILPTVAILTKEECYTKDMSVEIAQRVDNLLACMTMDEKIGQMTQVEKNSIRPGDITKYFIGSILSGGGGSPTGKNTPEGWAEMVNGFQEQALVTRLGIPIIYGTDAVHGHGNLFGATIFPQEIGLGAANDPALMEKIGLATAEELIATGVTWNFAPMVAVPQDIRWGRTYEAYSENTELVSSLGAAYVKGLQTKPSGINVDAGDSIYVLATPKHFLGDGGTKFGTATLNISQPYLILKNQNKIKFTLETTCFQGTKTFFNINYLNVMNIGNDLYNLETEIDEYVKQNIQDIPDIKSYELKSNIIYKNKQFLQFKIDNEVNIEAETKLLIEFEVDKIKFSKNKTYQIMLHLLNYQIL